MAKITKLELDKKLKEWQEQAIINGQNLQKGLVRSLIVVIPRIQARRIFQL